MSTSPSEAGGSKRAGSGRPRCRPPDLAIDVLAASASQWRNTAAVDHAIRGGPVEIVEIDRRLGVFLARLIAGPDRLQPCRLPAETITTLPYWSVFCSVRRAGWVSL